MLTQYCTELWRSYAVALTNDPPALMYTEYKPNLSEFDCVPLVKFFSIPCSVWNSTWRHSHFLIVLTMMRNAWGSISVYTLCIYIAWGYMCVSIYTVSLSTSCAAVCGSWKRITMRYYAYETLTHWVLPWQFHLSNRWIPKRSKKSGRV